MQTQMDANRPLHLSHSIHTVLPATHRVEVCKVSSGKAVRIHVDDSHSSNIYYIESVFKDNGQNWTYIHPSVRVNHLCFKAEVIINEVYFQKIPPSEL